MQWPSQILPKSPIDIFCWYPPPKNSFGKLWPYWVKSSFKGHLFFMLLSQSSENRLGWLVGILKYILIVHFMFVKFVTWNKIVGEVLRGWLSNFNLVCQVCMYTQPLSTHRQRDGFQTYQLSFDPHDPLVFKLRQTSRQTRRPARSQTGRKAGGWACR